jgi:hypothetical protein
MEELLDMFAADESPSEISDKIKELLYAKSANAIDEIRPAVAASLLGLDDQEEGDE